MDPLSILLPALKVVYKLLAVYANSLKPPERVMTQRSQVDVTRGDFFRPEVTTGLSDYEDGKIRRRRNCKISSVPRND